jgi:hypothetical protein
MMTVAYTIKRDERETVAAYLGREGSDAPPRPQALFADRSLELKSVNGGWNGWSPDSSNTRYQPAGLSPDQIKRLKLKCLRL